MDLDISGLRSTILSDSRHLTTNHLHTPTTTHGQFFNQNPSILMDRMHDMHMAPDSTPMVSAPSIVCAPISSFFLIQSTLSSPLELRLSRPPEEHMPISSNATNIQYQLVVERQRRKISDMETHIRALEMDIVIWKTRFTTAQ